MYGYFSSVKFWVSSCYNFFMLRSFIMYIFTILFAGILCFISVWLILPTFIYNGQITSPLPNFLTAFANDQVTTIDLWSPLTKFNSSYAPLSLTAIAALSYDLTTGQTLYARNATKEVPMASLTKIMTAIISLEHPRFGDQYTVPKNALVGEDSMGLDKGEMLSLQELLYGLVLHSGNDAAETLAANFSGGRNAFIAAMNAKVATLGLSHTHYPNPTGLEGDGDQHTTAYDLLIITRYALTNFPLFDQVVGTFNITLPSSSIHKEYNLVNETNLVSSYPGVKGVKDGYTPEAGLCLVTYLDYNGHKIIAIILGSTDRRGDMKNLLDFSLQQEHIHPPQHE
jgi:D-alanyl-D-alanine carboxypeptidase